MRADSGMSKHNTEATQTPCLTLDRHSVADRLGGGRGGEKSSCGLRPGTCDRPQAPGAARGVQYDQDKLGIQRIRCRAARYHHLGWLAEGAARAARAWNRD